MDQHNSARRASWICSLAQLCIFCYCCCVVYAWDARIDPHPETLRTAIEHCNCTVEFPKISFNGSLKHPNAFRKVDDYTVDVLVTNPDMVLICRASYPVIWTFHDYPRVDDNMRSWDIRTERTFQDMNNISTYQFESTLFLGFRPPFRLPRVTCRDAMKPKAIQTAVVSVPHESYMRITILPNSDRSPKPATTRYGENPGCAINLTYNPNTNQVCCSTKNTTFFNRGCSDPASCQGFYSMTNCSNTINISYQTTDAEAVNCMDATKDLASYGNAGVIVCKSADMDPASDSHSATLPYFTSLNSNCSSRNSSKPAVLYTDLEKEVYLPDFLEICDPPIPNGPIYVTETVKFQCDGSFYHFASGYRWILKRRHKADEIKDFKTELILKSKLPSEKWIIKTIRKLVTDIYFNDTSVYEIICSAPIWNTFKWANKSIRVDVREPQPIEFIGGSSELIDKFQPNQILNCSATGKPSPILDWEWDSVPDWATVIPSNSNSWIAIQLPNDTSNLDDHLIRCKATQDRIHRESTKLFRLKKRESQTAIIIATTAVLGIFILGTLFCIKKYMHWTLLTRALNEGEMNYLLEGQPELAEDLDINGAIRACSLPFDKKKYEIDVKDLKPGEVIGEGNSCIVLKGVYKFRGGSFAVACKTLKPFKPIEVLKSLFCELKIQIFIGENENVVHLYGAQIKNLVQREIYIVTELCSNGSLLNFLQDKRDIFLKNYSFPVTGVSGPVQSGGSEGTDFAHLRVKNLLRWAQDIANGMAFIGAKGILHGDLAARNVLLTEGLTAKIGDFGLSHQLTDYTYTASDKLAQPWQWIAPECFYLNQFSIKSDVWSYGVTLWEIFSVGGIPWTGMGKLTPPRLYELLMGGTRMSKPDLASQTVYSLIQSCWKTNARDRPPFQFLQAAFASLISDSSSLAPNFEFKCAPVPRRMTIPYDRLSGSPTYIEHTFLYNTDHNYENENAFV